jgi:hypothetical protein
VRRFAPLALASLAAAAACGTLESGDPGPPAFDAAAPDAPVDAGVTDDATPDVDAGSAPCDATAPWGSITPIVTRSDLYGNGVATLEEDERTIYFDALVAGPRATIFTGQRANIGEPFTAVGELANVPITTNDTYTPGLSPDGRTLFFTSNRVTGLYRLWLSTRVSPTGAFGIASPVTAIGFGSGTSPDDEPFAIADELWFVSTRTGNAEIFKAPILDGGAVGSAAIVAELESPALDVRPVLTRDGLTIFFGSTRGAGATLDVWTASRKSKSDAFAGATAVTELNTPQRDVPVWISADGCRLYLSSDRPPSTPGVVHVYVASRPR